METTATAASRESVYRVDSFMVPVAARGAFLERLVIIRDFLETQPGCLFNRIAEAPGADGFVRMVTIVEWRDRQSVENARARAAAHYEKTGFDPREFMQRLAIRPDMGTYRDIAA